MRRMRRMSPEHRSFRNRLQVLALLLFTISYVRSPGYAEARVTDTLTRLFVPDLNKTGRPAQPDEALYFTDILFPHRRHRVNEDDIAPRECKAIRLENGLIKLVQYPEFGGQILACTDKRTGKDIMSSPPRPRVMPFFLSQKALSVTFPTTEHGFGSLEPWPYTMSRDSIGVKTHFAYPDSTVGLKLSWITRVPHSGYFFDIE
ncbi:MAG: DUF5107 domain-containing protein, partial [Chitinivibrionales bacterium]|nr:DUF5107 domain-containing protein [Chitinivibrionales bacterium]MBD3357018.1 DUF5107 domain-containing protein [Chitinivibrionales bacterium]